MAHKKRFKGRNRAVECSASVLAGYLYRDFAPSFWVPAVTLLATQQDWARYAAVRNIQRMIVRDVEPDVVSVAISKRKLSQVRDEVLRLVPAWTRVDLRVLEDELKYPKGFVVIGGEREEDVEFTFDIERVELWGI